ncbi:hypothetical protein SEA_CHISANAKITSUNE_58 [Gordonia phage ChisanaKitsune]|uniref:Ryanodine receptor Ryr domain-containing protein n=1 Tax=Gordonia phage ChisanaKitsune TaxID=2871538 RepID=A0AAE8C194_9CAUD|nr:hypothetical protein PQD15_gp058 [Gordonia phage ChisanaKitsune]QZE10827.1 hypothetical protein SEA_CHISANAKITSUNE_58 [Gordonia phage ChisanaKitsune]
MTNPVPQFSVTEIAKIAHEANRALCWALGDDDAGPWEELGEDMQASVEHGVRVVQESEDHGPEELHRQWVMVREAQGWTYGKELDRNGKVHPNLVPYDELPREQQTKDRLFLSVVRSLSGMDVK